MGHLGSREIAWPLCTPLTPFSTPSIFWPLLYSWPLTGQAGPRLTPQALLWCPPRRCIGQLIGCHCCIRVFPVGFHPFESDFVEVGELLVLEGLSGPLDCDFVAHHCLNPLQRTNWHVACRFCSMEEEATFPKWHVACWCCSMDEETTCPNWLVACQCCSMRISMWFVNFAPWTKIQHDKLAYGLLALLH